MFLRSGFWGGQSIVLRKLAVSFFSPSLISHISVHIHSIELPFHSGRMDRNTCRFLKIWSKSGAWFSPLSQRQKLYKCCLSDGDSFGGLPGLAWLLGVPLPFISSVAFNNFLEKPLFFHKIIFLWLSPSLQKWSILYQISSEHISCGKKNCT